MGTPGSRMLFPGGADKFHLRIAGNARDVLLRGLDIEGTGIGMLDGGGYHNIRLFGNKIKADNGTPGIKATISSNILTIDSNFFHDYNQYGMILFHVTSCAVINNIFDNIFQGAHILNSLQTSFSFNKGTRLRRMLVEMQRLGSFICRDITVRGNQAKDWKDRFNDSELASICVDQGVNVKVLDNWGLAGANTPWNRFQYPNGSWSQDRWGYGIEASFSTGEVSNNILGGPWWYHVAVAGAGGQNTNPMPVINNGFYGVPSGGNYIVTHSAPVKPPIDQNNVKDPDLSHMPQPGQSPGPIPPPDPTPAPAPPRKVVKVTCHYDDGATEVIG
jgi:hypothetical protein